MNSFFESQGDNFRVDPDKVDFEEIRQKIESLEPNVSLKTSFDFGSLPKFTRDRIYPEYEAAKILAKNPANRQAAEEFFTGCVYYGGKSRSI
jgi:5'-3' exonuclease